MVNPNTAGKEAANAANDRNYDELWRRLKVALRSRSMRERDLFIDGHWRTAQSRRRLAINDPATGERVGSTAMADAADVDAAVNAAERALPGWAAMHRRRPRAHPASRRRL